MIELDRNSSERISINYCFCIYLRKYKADVDYEKNPNSVILLVIHNDNFEIGVDAGKNDCSLVSFDLIYYKFLFFN